MGYIKADFEQLKDNLKDLVGKEILIVEAISKRGKKLGKLATISNTYKNYFSVKFDDEHLINYNYSDLFTKDIKIKTFNGDSFNNLDIPRPLTKKETIPSLDMSEFSDINGFYD
ncbi:MAG: Veg family protein [Clostridium sp.]